MTDIRTWPPDLDISQVLPVLDIARLRKGATEITMVCDRQHVIGRVLRIKGEVYVISPGTSLDNRADGPWKVLAIDLLPDDDEATVFGARCRCGYNPPRVRVGWLREHMGAPGSRTPRRVVVPRPPDAQIQMDEMLNGRIPWPDGDPRDSGENLEDDAD